ncbi:MAG: hypothetical protein Q7V63_06520 [Gammaproteobacteria bacterium]|nr:hypothetical protein [Gammaproteobacteria bacterium]
MSKSSMGSSAEFEEGDSSGDGAAGYSVMPESQPKVPVSTPKSKLTLINAIFKMPGVTQRKIRENIAAIRSLSVRESFCCCFYKTFKTTLAPLLDRNLEDISTETLMNLHRLICKEAAAYDPAWASAIKKILGQQILARLSDNPQKLRVFMFENAKTRDMQVEALKNWRLYEIEHSDRDSMTRIVNPALQDIQTTFNLESRKDSVSAHASSYA